MKNLTDIKTNFGNDLDSLSKSFPVILVFLRHFECIFCKEAIRDLASRRAQLETKNVKVIFVHMSSEQVADTYFADSSFINAEHISDPNCHMYHDFGLSKGSFSQLFGLNIWARGYQLRKKGLKFSGKKLGDSLQMPGIFVIHKGEIVDSYIHKSISDRPNYDKFINCCTA